MKKTGIYRHVDALGRVVLPMEIRNQLDIQTGDCLDISVEGEKIVLKKQSARCAFCGTEKRLTSFCEKYVCLDCIEKLKENH